MEHPVQNSSTCFLGKDIKTVTFNANLYGARRLEDPIIQGAVDHCLNFQPQRSTGLIPKNIAAITNPCWFQDYFPRA
jgi:hypothetical protein